MEITSDGQCSFWNMEPAVTGRLYL
jgi:hypothetical protein